MCPRIRWRYGRTLNLWHFRSAAKPSGARPNFGSFASMLGPRVASLRGERLLDPAKNLDCEVSGAVGSVVPLEGEGGLVLAGIRVMQLALVARGLASIQRYGGPDVARDGRNTKTARGAVVT